MHIDMESAKRSMPDDQKPVLIALERNNPIVQLIRVDKNNFKIGRAWESDQVIPDVLISRNHAVLKCDENGDWTITLLSSTFTLVNDTLLELGVAKQLSHGDIIQLSASGKYKYMFALCAKLSRGKNSPRIDQSLLETVLTPQRTFADTQENKRKELEEKLQMKQSEQNELRTQLDKLLKEQELAHGQTQHLNKHIADLQKHIRARNDAEILLQHMYNQLLSTLKAKRAKFEKRLNDERQKWLEALDMSKQEKKTVEKSMKEQMDKWRKQQAEWAIVVENLMKQETTAQVRLLSEKNQLEQKLKETEDALKEQAAITEQLQSMAIENERHAIAELPRTPGQDRLFIELLNDGTTDQIEILETIDLTIDSPAPSAEKDSGALGKVGVIMDQQFTCSVCSEVFINAVTLNCMHSFCHDCIRSWMKRNGNCPICRADIVAVNRSLALDGFIDGITENLFPELKARRNQILKEREAAVKPSTKIKAKRKQKTHQ